MKPKERVLIYSLLIALLAMNLSTFLSSTGRPAFAQPASPAAEEIGPARRVRLVPERGDRGEDIIIRNHEGHLRWADDAHHTAHSLAFIHVGKPMATMLQDERFQERRRELQDELRADAQERDEELRQLMEQAQAMDPNDPQFAARQQQLNLLYREFQRWQAEAQARVAKLETELMDEVYKEIVAAVDIVAEERNIDLVLRFLPVDEEFEPQSPQQAQMIYQNRTALRYPDGLDITDAVMEELGLSVD